MRSTVTPQPVAADRDNTIRQTVLQALACDRVPGWSFTGYFQGVQWQLLGDTAMRVTMPVGPHGADSAGNIDLSSLLVLFDAALASPVRIKLPAGTRLATTHINVQLTGVDTRHHVHIDTHMQGSAQAGAMRQLLVHGALHGDHGLTMIGNASFVQLPPPKELGDMAPLPWQRKELVQVPPLRLDELDEREGRIMAACEAALAASAAQPGTSFLQHFWGILPTPATDGASCALRVGPQLANRVGHVQGGILMGAAAATAQCAVPQHPVLSNLSAWFTTPGRGSVLQVRSWPVHSGRNFAVVRTEITGEGGVRVLEATSAHAA